jgi:hypothetical protein
MAGGERHHDRHQHAAEPAAERDQRVIARRGAPFRPAARQRPVADQAEHEEGRADQQRLIDDPEPPQHLPALV